MSKHYEKIKCFVTRFGTGFLSCNDDLQGKGIFTK